jgi:branched-chain amino acid transport system ATP-binding protein
LDPRATADDRGPAAIRPPSLEHRRSAARSELTVAGVEAGYGDLTVLRGVTVRPQPGAVEVVLGRNGVGKTTLLGAIAGVVRVREGTVAVDGRDITGLAAHRRAAAGIALVQEGKRVFRQRTVMENVRLGTFTQPLSRRDRAALCEAVLGQLPMLAERARDLAGHLSGGQLQMLAIAQALAARPRVLLLDEPSAGLAPVVAAELFQRIRRLATDGMTIVLVEQLAAEAVAIADHITVLNGGRVVSSGPADRFRDDEVLRAAYLAAGAPDVVPSA